MSGIRFQITRRGDWGRAAFVLGSAPRRLKRATKKALLQEGHFYRKHIVQGIRKQAPGGVPFQPLKPATIAARRRQGFGGKKALIRTGNLIGSINVVEIAGGVFVGILRTTRAKGGQSLVNIGAVHEFGTKDGKIPARPFIQPVFVKHLANAQKRMKTRISKNFGGAIGGHFAVSGGG